MELDSLRGKIKYIVIAIVILLASFFIYQVFLTLGSVLTEGNPNIHFSEVNETIGSAGYISHLSDQEYQDFPGLKKVVEMKKADIPFNNGSRYLGITKISEDERSFIISKYTKNYGKYYYNFLEYDGKYYDYFISLS